MMRCDGSHSLLSVTQHTLSVTVTLADNNFVSADWDDEPSDQHAAADPKHRRLVKPSPAYGGPLTQTPRDMKQVDAESHTAARSGGLAVAPGVQADPNWLDEDFDDS